MSCKCANARWLCRCQLVSTDDETVPVCKGDVAIGEPCDEYNDCSINNQCVVINPRFTLDAGAQCNGSLAASKACNDFNDCTNEDTADPVSDLCSSIMRFWLIFNRFWMPRSACCWPSMH
jgi:hypothetical protein